MSADTLDALEAAADLSALFTVAPVIPRNSREASGLCVAWAQEFAKAHSGREWDGEYVDTLREFFYAKYDAWLASTEDTKDNPHAKIGGGQ